ncbi:hypothetical protein ARMGADRAFT_1036490 [Armillaria gallica]|uniref:Uncharacterized protein n=1 Tax=Armillaria gallica TaxID=47427 RepID=A0A2H3CTK6_ARMGA|nr:hypothetical protein ARMGADRAFT_1036490 [Armillaria gallica]
MLQSKTWYVIYKGLWVGVVTSSNTANSATLGVSNCSQKGFKNQQDAVNTFNEALDEKEVKILSLSMANTHLNHIDDGNTSDDSLEITLLSDSSSDSSNLEIWMSAEEGSDNSDPDRSVPTSDTPSVQSDVPLDPPPLYKAIACLNLHENAVDQASYSHDETLYMVQSATYTGMTTDWSHASQLVLEQQGMPVRPKPVEYRSHADAHAAYEYAEHREMNIPKPIDFLHALEEAFDTPLNLGQDHPRCLEASINAVGVCGNSHESYESLEVVQEKFQSALDQPGHVVFLHANQYRCDRDVYPPTVPM